FPAPELQREFTAPDGRHRRADFWWENIRLVGEFDGRHKYADSRYTNGRSPEVVVWEEKLRENELREFDARITRWVWSDLENVQPFIRRLEAAGLRRIRPPAFR
ncbi:MAG: hypothetical protein Q8K56_00365, partial [Rhodoglobus sp.]|nr:hypothetical protein [Rhodoglobus sp.]